MRMRWSPRAGLHRMHCKSEVFALPRRRPRKHRQPTTTEVGMSEHPAKLAVLGAILLALAPRAARATQKFGPVQLSGNLQTANIVRTPDQNTYEYIMNRNIAHIQLDYDWLQSGKFYNKYDIPVIDSSRRLTWQFQQEIPPPAYGWDEIRRPFWMIKFLYDVGDVWKLSQNFLEWYWNPGDWYPAKQAFLPRPWGLPFLNPLTNPVDGAFIGGVCSGSPFKFTQGPNAGSHFCTQLMSGTRLFEHGDYSRNPLDNSQVGVRYHAIAPFGLEFALVYFYQRFGGDDGTNYAPIKGLPNTTANRALAASLLRKGIFPAKFYAPYIHSVGASANYSEETYTQTVFRAETLFDSGMPFFDLAKETTIDNPALPGITKKNMWKGMLAFDRPTWIKSLNKKSTVFLTGQFFFHYLIDNPGCDAQRVFPFEKAKKAAGECLVGALDLPSSVRNGSVGNPSYRDKIRDWETLFTLAAFTFYRGGSILPVLGVAVDATNQFSMEPFWALDYVVRDDFVVNLAQRYFVTPRGRSTPIFDTWGLGGLNNSRSETELRLTYQF